MTTKKLNIQEFLDQDQKIVFSHGLQYSLNYSMTKKTFLLCGRVKNPSIGLTRYSEKTQRLFLT